MVLGNRRKKSKTPENYPKTQKLIEVMRTQSKCFKTRHKKTNIIYIYACINTLFVFALYT